MRVAHLLRKYNPAEWGGTETAIHQLTGGLRRHGVDSIAYCPTLASPALTDPLAEGGCTVKRFRACVPIWGISQERKNQLLAVGGNLMSFNLIRLLAFEPGLGLIHSHALGRVGAIGRTIARRRGLPFVVSVHGGLYDLPPDLRRSFTAPAAGGWEWGKPFGMILRSRQLLSDADAIVTCNRREADLIRERHPDRYVYVQPHGVPAARFQVAHRAAALAAFPALAHRPFLLAVGRIDSVKNPGWVVAQMPALLQRHPGTVLVLAGACTDEAYGAGLSAQIRTLGLENQVLLTGKIPPGGPVLIGLLQQAQAVLLPSVSETFGIVILEAWAAGTPVLASRTTGATALVESGENGALFSLDRPVEFHDGVDAVLSSPPTRDRWIAAGRRRVLEEFDCDALSGKMKWLYEHAQEANHAHRRNTR